MVSSSKILTVSYGTFSCTAEGFEDPLAVVKETTHFFRSVVSNDRFFGAEPPQFDADMATEMMRAHIAQSSADQGTLTLGKPVSVPSGASSGALAAALAAGPARVQPRVPAAPRTDVSHPETAAYAAPYAGIALPDDDTIEATAVLTEVEHPVDLSAIQPATPTAPHTVTPVAEEVPAPAPRPSNPESVAAKLDRIRAVVASNASDSAPHDAPHDGAEDDTDAAPARSDRATAPLAAAIAAVTGSATADVLPESLFAPEQDQEPESAPEQAPQQALDQALVEPHEQTSGPGLLSDDDLDDDLVDDDALDALLGELRDGAASADQADLAQPAAEPPTLTISDSALADSIASLMGADDVADAAKEDIARDAFARDEHDEDEDEDDDDSIWDAADYALTEDTAEDDLLDDDLDGTDDDETQLTSVDDSDPDALVAQHAPQNVFADEDDARDDMSADAPVLQPAPPLRARVVKIKRADFLRAVEQGQLVEDDEDDTDMDTGDADAAQHAAGEQALNQAPTQAPTATPTATPTQAATPAKPAAPALPLADESTLSPEEEDELARELAAVKAELSGEFDAWDDEDADNEDDLPAPLATLPRARTTAVSDWDDDDEDDEEDDLPVVTQAQARADGWDDEASYYDDDDEEEDDYVEAAAPLRLDNPMIPEKAETSRWPTDLDAIDARAPGQLGQSAHDDEDDEDDEEEVDPLEAMIRDSARKTVKLASPARVMLTEREVEDDDTLRLMDQTNTEMDEPEGNRRRTAIAHLRAAVAATKADRLLGRKADAAEEQEPYREDLASVVRPRRPQVPAAHRTERPADPASRPAPLKLVAEQRVATDSPRDAGAASDLPRTVPVRPRRVQRVAEIIAPREADVTPIDGDGAGFVAYAEQVGATELPELLEAAAAYMAYVEGRDQFSRPQLMSTVRMAEATESSREDRLRSFGQLLREGKIKKTAGGRFTASDRIRFKPDRAAG